MKGIPYGEAAGHEPHFEYAQLDHIVLLKRHGRPFPRVPEAYDFLTALQDCNTGTMTKVGDDVGLHTLGKSAKGRGRDLLVLVTGDADLATLGSYVHDQLGSTRVLTTTVPISGGRSNGDGKGKGKARSSEADRGQTARTKGKEPRR